MQRSTWGRVRWTKIERCPQHVCTCTSRLAPCLGLSPPQPDAACPLAAHSISAVTEVLVVFDELASSYSWLSERAGSEGYEGEFDSAEDFAEESIELLATLVSTLKDAAAASVGRSNLDFLQQRWRKWNGKWQQLRGPEWAPGVLTKVMAEMLQRLPSQVESTLGGTQMSFLTLVEVQDPVAKLGMTRRVDKSC